MGLKDPHDPRQFTHFAKMNLDGTVAALVEVADANIILAHPSADGNVYVDVTDLRAQKIDPFPTKVDAALIAAAKASGKPTDAALKDAFHATALAAKKTVVDVAGDG